MPEGPRVAKAHEILATHMASKSSFARTHWMAMHHAEAKWDLKS